MKTMAVAWNGTTLNDKVKLLSVTELGYSNQYAALEGNRYYEYGPHIKDEAYWLRTKFTSDGSNTWRVATTGYMWVDHFSTSFTLVPVIRLG